MPTYLDVGLVRIQKYLNRTPKLTRRRGASAMVAMATAEASVVKAVAGVSANPEAVDADGVVHLIVSDVDGDPSEVASRVVLHLASILPAAEIEASWAVADDYAKAHGALEAKRNSSLMRLLPSAMDVPLVQRCDGCAQAGVSVRRKSETPGQKRLDGFCLDCEARNTAAGKRSLKGAIGAGLDAEQELLGQLNGGSTPADLSGAQEFEDLAKLGFDEKNNHLATVFIDGNKIGDWFRYVGKEHPQQIRDLSSAVTEATKAALLAGAKAIQRNTKTLATVVHIRGGDDVLVSVPADCAWNFTLSFLETFGTAMHASLQKLHFGEDSGPATPSASAGIAIAKTAYPLSDSIDIAAELLAGAKRSNKGSAAAVLWLDVTRHGPKPPELRKARSLEWLTKHREEISLITELEQSARSTLRAMCEVEQPTRTDADNIRSQCKRLGIMIGTFTEPRESDHVLDLADLLDIARWWGTAK